MKTITDESEVEIVTCEKCNFTGLAEEFETINGKMYCKICAEQLNDEMYRDELNEQKYEERRLNEKS